MGRVKSEIPQKKETPNNTIRAKDVPVGFTFLKFFPRYGWFKGEVVQIRVSARYNRTRRVVYDDGDVEDMSVKEIGMADFLSRDIPINISKDGTDRVRVSSKKNRLITNPIAPIPANPRSHNLGWAQVWSKQLGVSLDHKCSENVSKAELVYVYHGVNYTPGKLNLFDGASKALYDRLNLLISCKNLISLDFEMPDYGELLKKRIGSRSTVKEINVEWCKKVSNKLKNIPVLRQGDLGFKSVTMGDSHCIAFSHDGDLIIRYDGMTLFGALERGLDLLLRGVEPYQNLVLCFGSIDIRHHILRQTDFNMSNFIKEYIKQGNALKERYGCNVFYCCPVPVEHEARRIPKSGYYKGDPFFGTYDDRRKITNEFIKELQHQAGHHIIQPPKEWYQMDGELYAKNFMECSSSFHIAPTFHRRNNWGRFSDDHDKRRKIT